MAEYEKRAWEARWYLWDGGFFAMGEATGAVLPHAHHAIQISIPLGDKPVFYRRNTTDEWRAYMGAIVSADEQHSFKPNDQLIAMLFVDPESREGHWLRNGLNAPVTEIELERVQWCVAGLRDLWQRPRSGAGTAQLIHDVVQHLCVGPEPRRVVDERVQKAIEHIRDMPTAKLSLEQAAASVFLSPSRFLHLWTEHVGLPFRRYLLWRRLTRALLLVGRGSSLTDAAHATGFSDSAHLTRTCQQMFGMPPSALITQGEHYEIPAPFEVTTR